MLDRVRTKLDTFVMRAVIFAVGLFAGMSGWVLFASQSHESTTIAERVARAPQVDVQTQFRDVRTACKRGEARERAACERGARQRLLAGVRHEAARLSLR
jgi:hypothetical protein